MGHRTDVSQLYTPRFSNLERVEGLKSRILLCSYFVLLLTNNKFDSLGRCFKIRRQKENLFSRFIKCYSNPFHFVMKGHTRLVSTFILIFIFTFKIQEVLEAWRLSIIPFFSSSLAVLSDLHCYIVNIDIFCFRTLKF